MPRKRAQTKKNRTTPRLPAGNEGHDLSADERAEKLELILKDFDQKVQAHIENIQQNGKKIEQALVGYHRRELIKLKPLLDMKMSDFFSSGGTIDEQAQKEVWDQTKEIETLINARFKVDSVPRATRQMDTISEEGNENMHPPMKTNRILRTTRKGESVSSSKFTTPFHGRGIPSAADTPMFTPRFDPKLPNTPAIVRVAKPSEPMKLVSMSLAGSPLKETNYLGVEGSTLTMSVSQMDEPEEIMAQIASQNLDRQTLSVVSKLFEKMSAMLKPNTP